MYKIAICDCDTDSNIQLVSILNDIAADEAIEISIDVYKSFECLSKHIDEKKYNLLFIEANNQGFSGIEFVRELRNKYSSLNTEVVFISQTDVFALSAFKVFPVGYLVKPFNKCKTRIPFCHAYKMTEKKKAFIFKAMGGGNVAVSIDEILYIEVIGTELDIHTFCCSYRCVGALSEVCKQLPGGIFYRSHRSFIVNLKYVSKINKYCFIMTNGDRVTIAKNRYTQAKGIFSKYIG